MECHHSHRSMFSLNLDRSWAFKITNKNHPAFPQPLLLWYHPLAQSKVSSAQHTVFHSSSQPPCVWGTIICPDYRRKDQRTSILSVLSGMWQNWMPDSRLSDSKSYALNHQVLYLCPRVKTRVAGWEGNHMLQVLRGRRPSYSFVLKIKAWATFYLITRVSLYMDTFLKKQLWMGSNAKHTHQFYSDLGFEDSVDRTCQPSTPLTGNPTRNARLTPQSLSHRTSRSAFPFSACDRLFKTCLNSFKRGVNPEVISFKVSYSSENIDADAVNLSPDNKCSQAQVGVAPHGAPRTAASSCSVQESKLSSSTRGKVLLMLEHTALRGVSAWTALARIHRTRQ